jgi:hypothetical protein
LLNSNGFHIARKTVLAQADMQRINKRFHRFSLERIQLIPEKLGGQIGQLLAESMGETMFLVKKNGREPAIRQGMIPPRSDEFLTAIDAAGILKISKAVACQLMRTKEISQ